MRFRILTDSQIEQFHLATLEVLERTGVRVLSEKALKLLKDAGCWMKKDNIVKIPAYLVEEAIRSAPPRITLSKRGGPTYIFLEGFRSSFGTGSDCVRTLDSFTGKHRLSVKKDVADAATVCDALDNINFVMSLALASDCPEKTSDLHQFEAMLENTEKPVFFTSHNINNLKVIMDMAWEVSGGKEAFAENPFCIKYIESISPLTHSPDGLESLMFCAENLIPVVYVSGMMSGATGPVTTTGALVVSSAEALSGLAVHQLTRKGAPIISGGQSTVMDLRTSKFCHGAPEMHLSHAAMADVYHHYQLPIWGSAGCSDSNLCDEQAALEYMMSILLSVQSGSNFVHDVGFLDSSMTGSLESVVMCDEIIDMVRRVMRGVGTTDADFSLDVIDRVGPGGEYLSDEHTLKLFKTEHWTPKLLNRHEYETWREMGQKDMRTRLNERVKDILETHKPKPMDPKIQESVARIIEEYEKSVIA